MKPDGSVAGGGVRTHFEIATSPHIKRPLSTDQIMRGVALSLLPVVGGALYYFGLGALLVILSGTAACMVAEASLQRLSGRPCTLGDGSALVTGLLFALTLPPALPLWMAALGGAIAILVGKFAMGGLGGNVFNPALVGRAFLLAAFPGAMTYWTAPLGAERWSTLPASTLTPPLLAPAADGLSGATPLGAFKFSHTGTEPWELFVGNVGGSLGETSSVLILVGGLYLAVRRMLDWRIPVAVLGTVLGLSALVHLFFPERCASPLFMVFAGGIMLGAVFMATDPVTSPTQPVAVWLFGIIVGALTVVIRVWGGLPEGTMYAILLGNAVAPLLERWFPRRTYGEHVRKVSQGG